MENCIFCKIVEKKINSDIIYEDDNIIAFRDIDPKAPVHILIIPKKHISSIVDIEEKNDIFYHIGIAINKIVKKMEIEKSGFRVVVNTGPDAGQAVNHLHFHLLAGRKFSWPPG